jgi:predicted nicotinamide N-methyase
MQTRRLGRQETETGSTVTSQALHARILADTAFEPAGDLVPEIRLLLATTPREILRESAVNKVNRSEPPYWAFAWPGGQALARFILDHPELVEGKRVLDVGAGSGLASIAAMKAGALVAVANDIDPLAAAVAELNARENDADIEISTDDLLDRAVSAGLMVIGDLVYEPHLEKRVLAFLLRAQAAGIPVLFGDRVSSRLPALAFKQIAEYETVVAPPLEDGYVEIARVWHLAPA